MKSGTVQSRRSCVGFLQKNDTQNVNDSRTAHTVSLNKAHTNPAPHLCSLFRLSRPPQIPPRLSEPATRPSRPLCSLSRQQHDTRTHTNTHKMRSHQSATHAPGPTLPLSPHRLFSLSPQNARCPPSFLQPNPPTAQPPCVPFYETSTAWPPGGSSHASTPPPSNAIVR